MAYKIAVIGGGSVLWMPRLGCDLNIAPVAEAIEDKFIQELEARI